jgi:hypothetical protein
MSSPFKIAPGEIYVVRDAPKEVQEAVDDAIESCTDSIRHHVGDNWAQITYDRKKHEARFVADGVEYSFCCKVVSRSHR